jgi:hypothetical protein
VAAPIASPIAQPSETAPITLSGAQQAGKAVHEGIKDAWNSPLNPVTATAHAILQGGHKWANDTAGQVQAITDFAKGVAGIDPVQPQTAIVQPGGVPYMRQPGQPTADQALAKVVPKMAGGTALYPDLDQLPEQATATTPTENAGLNGRVPKFDPNTMPELSLPDPRRSMRPLPTAVSGINPYSLESGMDVTGVTPTMFNALPALMMAKAGLAPYQNAVSQAKQARGEAVQDNKQGMELYNSMANRNLEAAKWARENQQNAWNATTGSFNAGLALQKNNIEQQDVDNKLALGKLGLTKRFGVNVTDATGLKKMVKIYDPATNSFVASAGAEADEQPEVKN